jgi:excisionase family DNA binding protein
MRKNTMQAELLRPLDAAAALNISRSKLYEEIHHGRIPVVKVGNLMRVPRAWIERQVDAALKAVEGEGQQ